MYQRCNGQGFEQLASRNCRPIPPEEVENDIEVEKTNYEIENSINSSINNKGFIIQLQIGALIIFDDVLSLGVEALANNINGNPFEMKLEENGNISINGKTFDISSSDGSKTIVIRNGNVSTE